MRRHFFTTAVLFLALTGPVAAAQAPELPAKLRSTAPWVVVDRILAGREVLALSTDQVTRLSRLAEHLRAERGRLVFTGLDRVPGKSVPRYARKRTTAGEAYRQAVTVLSAEQQARVAPLLGATHR